MSDHPIEKGRWAALHEEQHWHPMKGIVAHTSDALGLDPALVGRVIWEGMAAGTIAHKFINSTDQGWIIVPRGAELVRISGISYESHLDWSSGGIRVPGERLRPLALYWPDIKAAFDKPAQARVPPGGDRSSKRGPKGNLTRRAADKMLSDFRSGVITKSTLEREGQEALKARYGVRSRDTAVKAWEIALSEFVGVSNSDN